MPNQPAVECKLVAAAIEILAADWLVAGTPAAEWLPAAAFAPAIAIAASFADCKNNERDFYKMLKGSSNILIL